jgi:pimeloyl-ACP methyl ester carboxylesterase
MTSQSVSASERDVTFQSGSLTLAGTLLLPGSEGRYPGVLLLPGSGPLDRNENMKKMLINAMREIAGHLAGQGIATLRYDKRGVGASQGDYFETGFFDLVGDAAAALAFLKAQDLIWPERVFVLGHSEGSAIAMRLAGTDADVAGIVLLGGSAERGEELLLWQAEQVVPGMRGLNKWLIDLLHVDIRKSQLKQFEKIKRTKGNWYRQLWIKVNAKWLREFLAYNPSEDLKNTHTPVLAITGSKDIQVNPADLERMAQLVGGEFESHMLPDVTHMLRTDSGKPRVDNYPEQLRRPVDARILELVSDWLHRHTTDG